MQSRTDKNKEKDAGNGPIKKNNMETIKHESSLSKAISEKLIERLTDPKSHYGVFPTLVKIGSKFTRNF